MRINKRGASPLEFILSMILFMSFVAVTLYFFMPKSQELTSASLTYAFDGVLGESSVIVHSYSVAITDSGKGKEVIAVNTPGEIGRNSLVIASEGTKVLPSKRGVKGTADENLTFVRRDINNENDNFFTIILCDKFSEGSAGSTPSLNANYYSISSIRSRSVISEDEMLAMNASYYADYAGFKETLKIPTSSDFSFEISFIDRSKISAERFIPSGVDVYADTRRFEILRTNNKFDYADLLVKTWG